MSGGGFFYILANGLGVGTWLGQFSSGVFGVFGPIYFARYPDASFYRNADHSPYDSENAIFFFTDFHGDLAATDGFVGLRVFRL